MANDLSITLGANVDAAISNVKRFGNSVEDLRNRAASVDSSLKRMNWGMAANALAVGFQDAASVLSNNGTFGMALNAAGNNIIQVASMINPIAGGLAAAGIAAAQLVPLFTKAGAEAKKLKEHSTDFGKGFAALFTGAGPGKFAQDYNALLQKRTTLESQAATAASQLNAKIAERNQLWEANKNLLGRQMVDTAASKSIAILNVQIDAIKKLRDEAISDAAITETLLKSGAAMSADALKQAAWSKINKDREERAKAEKLEAEALNKSFGNQLREMGNAMERLRPIKLFRPGELELAQKLWDLKTTPLLKQDQVKEWERLENARLKEEDRQLRGRLEADMLHAADQRYIDHMDKVRGARYDLMNPMERLKKDSESIMKLIGASTDEGITPEQAQSLIARRLMGSDAVAAFSAPGVRRGSVEEAQLMNRARTESMRSSAAEAQAKIIAEEIAKALKDREPGQIDAIAGALGGAFDKALKDNKITISTVGR